MSESALGLALGPRASRSRLGARPSLSRTVGLSLRRRMRASAMPMLSRLTHSSYLHCTLIRSYLHQVT